MKKLEYKVFDVYDLPESIAEGFWDWRRDYNRTALKFTVEPNMIGEYGYKFMNELTQYLLDAGVEAYEEVIIFSD